MKKRWYITFLILFCAVIILTAPAAFASEKDMYDKDEYLINMYLVEHYYLNGSIKIKIEVDYAEEFYTYDDFEAINNMIKKYITDFYPNFIKKDIADGIEYEAPYNSIDSMYKYYDITGYEVDDNITKPSKSGIFFTTYEVDRTPKRFISMIETIKGIINLDYVDSKVKVSDINANYSYCTTAKRVKADLYTDTADDVKKTQKGTIFNWYDIDKVYDPKFVTVQTYPNTTNWYLTAIFSGLLVTFILFLISYKSSKKKGVGDEKK